MAGQSAASLPDYTMLVRVYAVVHQCEKRTVPGAPSTLSWSALGSASWCDLRFYINKAGDSMRLEGNFQDGSLFGVHNVSVASWRWGRRSDKERFCTLQRHKHATGAYGFFFPDSNTADRISLIINRYIPPKSPRGSDSAGQGSHAVTAQDGLDSDRGAEGSRAASAAPSASGASASGVLGPAASEGAASGAPQEGSPAEHGGGGADAEDEDASSPFQPPPAPSSWMHSKQFAVPLADLPCTHLAGYGSIPNVLLFLAGQVRQHGGLTSEGIFRISGEGSKVSAARAAIDTGDVAQALAQMDCNVAANLIKLFFRELQPELLLNCLPEAKLVPASKGSADAVQGLLEDADAIPPTQRGLFLWLVDVLLAVAENQPLNRMGEQALAVVLAPNLHFVQTANAMRIMELSQAAVAFLRKALAWRAANPSWQPSSD